MKKITKRDVLFFILGLIAMFIIESVYNWKDSVNSFKAGFRDGIKIENTEK